MLSPTEQARILIDKMRLEANQNLQLAQSIEERLADGEENLVMDGDEVVGFLFPQETEKVSSVYSD